MRSGAQMLASWRWLRVHAAFHPERLHWFRLHYCQVSQVVKEVSSDCACRYFRPTASLPPNVPFAPRCAAQFFLSLILVGGVQVCSSISRYQWQLCRWHAAGADLLFGVATFEIHPHHMKVPESMSGVCSQSFLQTIQSFSPILLQRLWRRMS